MQYVEVRRAAGRAATTATMIGTSVHRFSAELSTENSTAHALGWLVFYLVGRDIPARESQVGWALVEGWLSELVVQRHGLEAA